MCHAYNIYINFYRFTLGLMCSAKIKLLITLFMITMLNKEWVLCTHVPHFIQTSLADYKLR